MPPITEQTIEKDCNDFKVQQANNTEQISLIQLNYFNKF